MFGFKRKQESFLTQQQIQQAMLDLPQDPRFSPDLGWLEQHEYQLLFCPDETRRNQRKSSLLGETIFRGNGFTRKNFNYWEQRVGEERTGIPMQSFAPGVKTLFPSTLSKFPPALPIKGEIHAVRPKHFKELDDYRERGYKYLRKRVEILVPYKPLIKFNVDTRGKALPLALQGKKMMLGTEMVWVLRTWMYVGNPAYWDNLFDAGWSGFKPVPHIGPSRREWLGEYYVFTKHEFKDR